MHKCPHCQQESITSLQKICSVSFAPARCAECHQLSYVHAIYGLFAMTTWIVITWVFIGLSYMSNSSFFLLGTIPAMILAVNKYLLDAPLRGVYRS